jgi:hypothetical protein
MKVTISAGAAIDAIGLDRDGKCRRCGRAATWVFGTIDADGRRGAVVCHTPGAGPGRFVLAAEICTVWQEPPVPMPSATRRLSAEEFQAKVDAGDLAFNPVTGKGPRG